MTYMAPGKSHREGLSLIELMEMFPTEVPVCTRYGINSAARNALMISGVRTFSRSAFA